jgi:shikimate kinase
MRNNKNIYLIGYRACGKTTVGKALFSKFSDSHIPKNTCPALQYKNFIDTDEEIVKNEGLSIREIVSKHGFLYLRHLEKKNLKQISAQKDLIVATGGGIILDKKNIMLMKKSGLVFFLKASIETILKRLTNDRKTEDFRPRLSNKKLPEEIRETLKERLPIYIQSSDFSINTDKKSIEEILQKIIFKIQK